MSPATAPAISSRPPPARRRRSPRQAVDLERVFRLEISAVTTPAPNAAPAEQGGSAPVSGDRANSLLRQNLILYLCALAVRCVLIATVHWEIKNDSAHYMNLAA